MTDPTDNYKKVVDAAEKTAEGIFGRAEALFPMHERGATKLSREEEQRDYQMSKATPDGMRMRLREMRQKFGLARAWKYFAEWDKKNRD
jgi:hypothetical protein